MKLPLRLAKLDPPAPADAAVLFAHDPADLVRLCTQFPMFPTVFRVAGGFLLFANGPTWPAGVVKLRRLGGDLFVPADAELLPRLLPDEIVGLTQTTGLVVLVDTVLAFDPTHPLRPGEWLRPARVRREAWQSFPLPSDRAERLTAIERPAPPDEAAEILNEGRPDTSPHPDDARPPAGSLVDRARAGAALRAGQFLAWVGKQLSAPGLGKLGGKMARGAVERVPRLTEKILGAQEAALREVLRQLQSGDIEKALKRAPIAVADPAASGAASASTDLSNRDPRFSLGALLAGGGGASWLGGGDVWNQLAAEYRKLAEDAARRGDARRAAYLYGVLLRDVRSAANALVAGGYFREAGVLFRDKLGDLPAAAAAFERAGDYDEAVRLYERQEDYHLAAELFRRIGDEDRAVAYYERAADRMKNHGQWLAAGTLLRTKLGRQHPATECFRRGWRTNGPDAQTCGQRCVDDFLAAEDWPAFDDLLAEAAEAFVPPRDKEAATFFNHVLHVGHLVLPADRHAAVKDRVKLLFADHLRGGGSVRQATEKARTLFAPKGGWTGPRLRDAEYAAAAGAKRNEFVAPPSVSPPAGSVTAVLSIRLTRDLLLAVDDRVFLWKAATSERTCVARGVGRVIGLAASPDGSVIYVLSAVPDGVALGCSVHAQGPLQRGGYSPHGEWRSSDGGADWSLLPHVEFRDGEPVVLLARAAERVELRGYFLQATTTRAEQAYLWGSPPYLFERVSPTEYWEWDEVFCRRVDGPRTTRWATNVVPAPPAGSPLRGPLLDWLVTADRELLVACVTGGGVLVRATFTTDAHNIPSTSTADLEGVSVVAACFRGPQRLATATTGNEIVWVHAGGPRLITYHYTSKFHLPSPIIFLAAGSSAAEVLAVTADGSVVRVPAP